MVHAQWIPEPGLAAGRADDVPSRIRRADRVSVINSHASHGKYAHVHLLWNGNLSIPAGVRASGPRSDRPRRRVAGRLSPSACAKFRSIVPAYAQMQGRAPPASPPAVQRQDQTTKAERRNFAPVMAAACHRRPANQDTLIARKEPKGDEPTRRQPRRAVPDRDYRRWLCRLPLRAAPGTAAAARGRRDRDRLTDRLHALHVAAARGRRRNGRSAAYRGLAVGHAAAHPPHPRPRRRR